jgi:hypothetical protein
MILSSRYAKLYLKGFSRGVRLLIAIGLTKKGASREAPFFEFSDVDI